MRYYYQIKPLINRRQQSQALETLCRCDVPAHELKQIASTPCVSKLVYEFRVLGWSVWVCRVIRPSRSGKPWMPDIYWMSDEMKRLAVTAIDEGSAETAPTIPEEGISVTSKQSIAGGLDND